MARRLVVIVLLASAIWFGCWVAARALIVKKEIPYADAIVVLAGSSTYIERVRLAARLLAEGRGSTIVLTNDGLLSGWSAADERNLFFFERSIAELRRLGVPARQITTIPGRVNNTQEEAVAVREYAKANGLRSILVVTAPYQARRALWVFQRTFDGSGITIGLDSPAPGEQSPHPTTWWTRSLGWKLVPGEYIKLIYYRWNYSDRSYAAAVYTKYRIPPTAVGGSFQVLSTNTDLTPSL